MWSDAFSLPPVALPELLSLLLVLLAIAFHINTHTHAHMSKSTIRAVPKVCARLRRFRGSSLLCFSWPLKRRRKNGACFQKIECVCCSCDSETEPLQNSQKQAGLGVVKEEGASLGVEMDCLSRSLSFFNFFPCFDRCVLLLPEGLPEPPRHLRVVSTSEGSIQLRWDFAEDGIFATRFKVGPNLCPIAQIPKLDRSFSRCVHR